MVKTVLLAVALLGALATSSCSEERPAARAPAAVPTTAQEPDAVKPAESNALPDVIALEELPPLGAPGVDSTDTEAVTRYGASNEDTFAGALLAGGRLWVGFTSDHERHLTQLRELVSVPEQIGVFRARHPMAELRRLQDRISQDTTLLRGEGMRISVVSADVVRNRVHIGVENAADPAIVEALHRRYPGDLILVEPGVVVRPVSGNG